MGTPEFTPIHAVLMVECRKCRRVFVNAVATAVTSYTLLRFSNDQKRSWSRESRWTVAFFLVASGRGSERTDSRVGKYQRMSRLTRARR